jgi:hypothetical protein
LNGTDEKVLILHIHEEARLDEASRRTTAVTSDTKNEPEDRIERANDMVSSPKTGKIHQFIIHMPYNFQDQNTYNGRTLSNSKSVG